MLIGKLIPAGTGMKRYRNVRLNTDITMEDDIELEEDEFGELDDLDELELDEELPIFPEEENEDDLLEEVLDFGEEEI